MVVHFAGLRISVVVDLQASDIDSEWTVTTESLYHIVYQ